MTENQKAMAWDRLYRGVEETIEANLKALNFTNAKAAKDIKYLMDSAAAVEIAKDKG